MSTRTFSYCDLLSGALIQPASVTAGTRLVLYRNARCRARIRSVRSAPAHPDEAFKVPKPTPQKKAGRAGFRAARPPLQIIGGFYLATCCEVPDLGPLTVRSAYEAWHPLLFYLQGPKCRWHPLCRRRCRIMSMLEIRCPRSEEVVVFRQVRRIQARLFCGALVPVLFG